MSLYENMNFMPRHRLSTFKTSLAVMAFLSAPTSGQAIFKLQGEKMECAGTEKQLGTFHTVEECAAECLKTADCKYFLFGRVDAPSRMGQCWHQYDNACEVDPCEGQVELLCEGDNCTDDEGKTMDTSVVGNGKECPSGTQPVITLSACESIAKQMGYPNSDFGPNSRFVAYGELSEKDRPVGCYRTKDNKLFFNQDSGPAPGWEGDLLEGRSDIICSGSKKFGVGRYADLSSFGFKTKTLTQFKVPTNCVATLYTGLHYAVGRETFGFRSSAYILPGRFPDNAASSMVVSSGNDQYNPYYNLYKVTTSEHKGLSEEAMEDFIWTNLQSKNALEFGATQWGTWGALETCPEGEFVTSFQTVNEAHKPDFDDTALNTIRLFCSTRQTDEAKKITSKMGAYGQESRIKDCPVGYMTGAKATAEKAIDGDNVAMAAFSMLCGDIEVKSGIGHWSWGDEQENKCPPGEGVYGIRTKVKDPVHEGFWDYETDETAMNRAILMCAPLPLDACTDVEVKVTSIKNSRPTDKDTKAFSDELRFNNCRSGTARKTLNQKRTFNKTLKHQYSFTGSFEQMFSVAMTTEVGMTVKEGIVVAGASFSAKKTLKAESKTTISASSTMVDGSSTSTTTTFESGFAIDVSPWTRLSYNQLVTKYTGTASWSGVAVCKNRNGVVLETLDVSGKYNGATVIAEDDVISEETCASSAFTKESGKYCDVSDDQKSYATFEEARKACIDTEKCSGIWELYCNKEAFNLCLEDPKKYQTAKQSCIWQKKADSLTAPDARRMEPAAARRMEPAAAAPGFTSN